MPHPAKKLSSSSSATKNPSGTPPLARRSVQPSLHLCTFCRERTAFWLCLTCQRRLSTLFSQTRPMGLVRTISRIRAGRLQVVISTTIPMRAGLSSSHLLQPILSVLRKHKLTPMSSATSTDSTNSEDSSETPAGDASAPLSSGSTQGRYAPRGQSKDPSESTSASYSLSKE